MKAALAVLSLVALTTFADAPLAVRVVSFVDPDSTDPNSTQARVVVLAAIPDGVPSAARSAVSLDVRVIGSRDRVVGSRTDTFDVTGVQPDLATSVTVPRGRYRVEATLRAGDVLSTGTVSVDIPDFTWASLSMSDVVFSSDERRVLVADTARGLLPVAPVARLEFSVKDRVSVFARLHSGVTADPSRVTMTATIARPGQRPVFTDVTPATVSKGFGRRTADYRLWLPLDQLGVGDWTLVLRARSDDRFTATREVSFTVR